MRTYSLSITRLLLLLALSVAALARAEESAQASDKPMLLTSQGRFLVAGELGGGWSDDGHAQLGSLARWNVTGSAKLTYFFWDHIGLGASLGGGASATEGTISSRYGAQERSQHFSTGLHAAFNWQLAPRLSVMFQPAVLYMRQWLRAGPEERGALFQRQATLSAPVRTYELGYVRTALNVPLIFHVSKNVGLGFGPSLWFDFIVERHPDYGDEIYQATSSNPVGARRAAGPLPRHTRLQVGLLTTIVVAI